MPKVQAITQPSTITMYPEYHPCRSVQEDIQSYWKSICTTRDQQLAAMGKRNRNLLTLVIILGILDVAFAVAIAHFVMGGAK